MSLTRRSLTLALTAIPLAASPLAGEALAQTGRVQSALEPGDQAQVDRAIAYLEGLTEAQGRFAQTDPHGRTTTGQLFIKRPGKARFAYDPPSGLLVVSDGGVVSVQDKRLKTFDKYPLAATPLSLFLARSIRLDKGVAVTRVARMADGFTITARDGKKQTAGTITLSFTEKPLALAGWTVTDAQGRPTRVQLLGLEPASGLDKSLFVLKDPRPKNVGRGKV